ncbi:hypothetical protein [Soonwooa purpurea]
MENLTILNKQTSVNAQEIILDNTVDYSWTTTSDESAPTAINFYVKRGVAGSENFNGNNVIQGEFYSSGNGFNVRNSGFQFGDEVLYLSILDTCQAICAGDPDALQKFESKK